MSIRKPTANRDSVLGVEYVGSGRIVDDDRVLQVPSYLRQILHVIALMIVAAVAEKSVVHHVVDVELIQERVTVLQQNVSSLYGVGKRVLLTLDTDAVKTTTS